MNMLKNGEVWKHTRSGLQPDLLSPQAAQSYLPLLVPVTHSASEALPRFCHDLELFSMRAAFDMFTAAMLGHSTNSLKPDAAQKDLDFIDNSNKMFRLLAELLYSAYETKLRDVMDTQKYKEFDASVSDLMVYADEVARKAVAGVQRTSRQVAAASVTAGDGVGEGSDAGQEAERLWTGEGVEEVSDATGMKDCYVRRACERGGLTIDELVSEFAFLFLAGVDTTSSYMNWFLYHLAANPEKQERLATELHAVLGGGDFSKDPSLTVPYLKACYRETHRMNPLGPTTTSRNLQKDIEIGGYEIPKGTPVNFNLMAVQHDPRYCERPEEYLPERWLDEAVAARKGTEQELLDHRLLATPFSFGARMCMGGRLAEAEILSLVARLVQDWEISVAPDCPPIEPTQRIMIMPNPSPKLTVRLRKRL